MNTINLRKAALSTAMVLFCTTAFSPIHAADIESKISDINPWAGTKWLIRGRLLGVIPDESNATLGGASAALTAEDSIQPELDFTYFFNDHIAAELILAVSEHSAFLGGAEVTEVLLLPPTLTLQYHHAFGAFKPYAGAGLNYTRVISSSPTAAIGGIDDFDDSFGLALQVGFDYAIDDKWSVNFDVKKLFINLSGTVTGAGTPVSIDIDPWVVGLGVGYRF